MLTTDCSQTKCGQMHMTILHFVNAGVRTRATTFENITAFQQKLLYTEAFQGLGSERVRDLGFFSCRKSDATSLAESLRASTHTILYIRADQIKAANWLADTAKRFVHATKSAPAWGASRAVAASKLTSATGGTKPTNYIAVWARNTHVIASSVRHAILLKHIASIHQILYIVESDFYARPKLQHEWKWALVNACQPYRHL